jgi:glyoxylase I family protein
MRLSGIHHVSLSVRDLDRSRDWYTRVFGLDVLMEERADERDACVLVFPGTTVAVGLTRHAGNDGAAFAPERTGLDHVAFTAATRSDLDVCIARLDELGVAHSGAIDVPPGAIVNFRDPDGIALALFWDRP